MATKNIAITDMAYELLSRNKLHGESFSQVIISHFKKKKHLLDYAGIWEEVPDDEWKEFERSIKAARSGLHDSMKKRIRGT